MSKLKGAVIFTLGAATGSVVTFLITKAKFQKNYQKRLQEEVDSIRKTEKERNASLKKEKPEKKEEKKEAAKVVDKVVEKPDLYKYANILRNNDYIPKGDAAKLKEDPYVISPDDFGMEDDYETNSLMYYEDQVLATANDDEVIDNVDEIVGEESLSHFGEYEDDCVYVRNDKLKCDFEILLSQKTYSEIMQKRPHPIYQDSGFVRSGEPLE